MADKEALLQRAVLNLDERVQFLEQAVEELQTTTQQMAGDVVAALRPFQGVQHRLVLNQGLPAALCGTCPARTPGKYCRHECMRHTTEGSDAE